MKGSLDAKSWILAVGGMALAAAISPLVAHSPQTNSPSPNTAVSGYVDPAICAGCHAEIAKTYRLTGMGRSLTLPSPTHTIEDYKSRNTVYHQQSGLYYTMVERDGVFYQRRHELGFGGKETNVVEERIDYIIGSGNHARSYLHRTLGGKLVELPVTWYTEGSGYWAMSPGFDQTKQLDFHRGIDGVCMSCHNGFPPGEKYPVSTDEAIFPKAIPAGIDCQRCHGPGGSHVQAALSGRATAELIRDAVVNPARLSRDRQLDVCMQCHLETDNLLTPNEIRRYGRDLDAYRPGEPLGRFKIYFDQASEAGKADKFQIAHQAYRLRMSMCFRRSDMTCLTCHDPHQPYRTADSLRRYQAVCQNCHPTVVHKAELPAGANCISCHMPKRRTEDAVHVVMTDHYIQRIKPARDLLAPIAEVLNQPRTHTGVTVYYPPQPTEMPGSELYLAVAEVKNGADLPSACARLQDAIAKSAPNEPEPYFELAKGYSQAGKLDEAIHWSSEALRRRSTFRPAIKLLAVSLIDKGQFQQAAEVLRRATPLPPADDALFTDLGNAFLRLHMPGPAQQALRRALELNPEQPEAQNLLGMLAVERGDAAEAEKRFRSALRSQPDYAEAHNNLGNVLAGNGNYEEAAYHFQRAITLDPGNAKAHHSYGIILEMEHSYDKGIAELRSALALDPNDAEIHSDLADVLLPQGHTEEAAAEYRQAIRLKPDLVEAHISLGNLLAAQGKFEDAKREFLVSLQLEPDSYEAHLGLGLILMHEGKREEARLHCQKAMGSPDPAIRGAAQKALDDLGR